MPPGELARQSGDLARLSGEITKTNIKLEHEIGPKIQVIYEGFVGVTETRIDQIRIEVLEETAKVHGVALREHSKVLGDLVKKTG